MRANLIRKIVGVCIAPIASVCSSSSYSQQPQKIPSELQGRWFHLIEDGADPQRSISLIVDQQSFAYSHEDGCQRVRWSQVAKTERETIFEVRAECAGEGMQWKRHEQWFLHKVGHYHFLITIQLRGDTARNLGFDLPKSYAYQKCEPQNVVEQPGGDLCRLP